MLQQDQGIGGDLRQTMGLFKGTGVFRGGHEDGVSGEAGGRLEVALTGGGGKSDVHLTGLEKAQHLMAAAGDDADMDGGVEAVEGVQMGQEELAGNGIGGTDGEMSHLQLTGLAQLVLTRFEKTNGAANVLIQQLAVRRQRHTAAVAGEQAGLQIALQLLDGLAHGRLTDIEGLGRGGDVARLCHLFEHLVKFQFDRHSSTLLP